jgi:O-antigen/teichoic acid export membrane protein
MLLGIVITPYWSSFTEAYTKGEMPWIRKSMKNLMKIAFLTVLLTVLLVLIAPFVYQLWIGDLVHIPFLLTLCMALYFVTNICYAPFVMFINGVGKIKLQMYLLVMGALLNIPLSIVLVRYTSLGNAAVILASFLCIFPNLILYPMQYFKLVNKTAHGIWNK